MFSIHVDTAPSVEASGFVGCFLQARRSINWGIFLTIGSAFGVSIAMENTGVASLIATFLVQVGTAIGGKVALLVCVYIATSFLSNFIANNAAAAIMFPISFQVNPIPEPWRLDPVLHSPSGRCRFTLSGGFAFILVHRYVGVEKGREESSGGQQPARAEWKETVLCCLVLEQPTFLLLGWMSAEPFAGPLTVRWQGNSALTTTS